MECLETADGKVMRVFRKMFHIKRGDKDREKTILLNHYCNEALRRHKKQVDLLMSTDKSEAYLGKIYVAK